MADASKTLLDEIRSTPNLGNGTKCGVQRILESLEPVDRNGLIEAMRDGAIQATTIARVLQERGTRLAAKAIQRHRRSECLCSDDYR